MVLLLLHLTRPVQQKALQDQGQQQQQQQLVLVRCQQLPLGLH
jgi:hypothetical protein